MLDWYVISITSFIEFVAVALGVLAAFELDRRHEESMERAHEKEFLIFIREEVNINHETAGRLLPELKRTFYLPYYRLRSFALSSLSERIALIKNDKLRSDIIAAYAKFDMFERTLDRYLDLTYTLIKEFGDIMPSEFASVSEVSELMGDPKIFKRFPKSDLERQRARWKGLLKRTGEIWQALIGQIEQSKDGLNDFCLTLDSEIESEIRRLETRKRHWKAFLLTLTLIFGIISVVAGLAIQYQIWSGPHYSVSTFSTGAMVGWYPFNASVDPQIEIGILPFINDNVTSSMVITATGNALINGSFHFGFISPFIITSVSYHQGNWSYLNVTNFGSIIYYTQKMNTTHVNINGQAVFSFNNLPGKDDHGSYQVFIPFTGGIPSQLWEPVFNTYYFTYDQGVHNFLLDLDIPWSYAVTSSFPLFITTKSQLPPFCCGVLQQPLQSLQYNLTGNTSLSVSYENSTAVTQFMTEQNLELFYLALGIPLLLSSLFEFAKQSPKRIDYGEGQTLSFMGLYSNRSSSYR